MSDTEQSTTTGSAPSLQASTTDPATRLLVALLMTVLMSLGVAPAFASDNRAHRSGSAMAALDSSFVLLRRDRPTKPPAAVTSGFSAARYGLALSRAVVETLPGGPSLWLIPGTNDTCIAWVDKPQAMYANATYDAQCASDASVLKYGALVIIPSATHESIFGVQPGTARTVTATTNRGDKTKTASNNGVYVFVTRRPTFITAIATPGGRVPLFKPLRWI